MFQVGLVRDVITTDASQLTLKTLKDLACNFINQRFLDHGIPRLNECVNLFRHDYSKPNILQLINAASRSPMTPSSKSFFQQTSLKMESRSDLTSSTSTLTNRLPSAISAAKCSSDSCVKDSNVNIVL